VDRKALPPVEGMQAVPADSFVAPRSQVEQVIASIWEEVLHLERVGVTDDFFELGGHSLLATQVVSRLREAFKVELPLKALFQCTTVGALAGQVELAMQEAHGLAVTPLLPADRSMPLPLSYAQQRLWFLDRLEPGSPAWNIPTPLRLEGALDVPALEAALGTIIRRHEALRTRFALVEGQAVQVIDPPAPFVLPVLDLEPLAGDEQRDEVKRLVAEESSRPFDLARGPLMRAQLLRLGAREHVLLLTLHHIVADGWSLGVLTRELTALYAAYAAGEEPTLPDLPVQYADYAAWQRQWLQGAVLETQLSYWKTQLAEVPAVLDLPTDRPRPKVLSHRGAFGQFRLSRPLSDALRALSRQEGATLFMTLLAAFQTLLHRYSRQTDICVGTPIAGRRRVEVEGLIGFFLNTLVLRADLSDQPTFRQLLRRVRETTLGAYAHQDIPFEMLIEALQPERSTSHTPFFQAVFALQNTPKGELQLPGLTLSPLAFKREMVKADLSLSLTETDDGLTAELGYNTDLFDRATALRIAAHFETLLTALAADPDRPVGQIPFITEAERGLLLHEWSGPARPLPDKLVHQLIAERAAQVPDAVAVESATGRLTYGELNRRANQLAHWLRAAGVGPESMVGLCVERAPELLVGMLGVLKAGGAYVPLDQTYPRERLAFMLADTGAPVVLTQERLLAALPAHGARTLCLDTGWEAVSRCSDADPETLPTPDSTAYVIYTSGSTGKPKGAMVTHRGLLNHNLMAVREYGLGPADRVLQSASISFDISVEEIFPTLLSGGTLVLQPFERLPSIAEFRRMLQQERLTVVNLPTAYWHEWVAELVRTAAQPAVPETVRLVIVGGEKASAERFAQWRQSAGEGVEWLNTYGPTETTIICTFYRAQPGVVPAELPIGRPIDNTRIYLLDEHRQPVPVGVPGELYVGGAGVAKGYLNLPDQTGERFLPDPFAETPGRMYRTGDLARWLPDGTLQFLGRADNQVKIRGFRIEPSEVEAALCSHPAVEDAVVLPSADGDSLVAYYIPAQQPDPGEDELRAYLKERLPGYMVPAFYLAVEAWPMTPSGKVDRKALPPVTGRVAASPGTYVAPGTRLEQVIAAIWQEVLRQDQVGVHDNFFDLGGHSLLLIRVHSRLCEALRRELPMVDLFRHPTVSSLARHLADPTDDARIDFTESAERAESRREALKRQREARLGHRAPQSRRRDAAAAQDEEEQDDL
jgi:amino acid adenylation domain-containing protein